MIDSGFQDVLGLAKKLLNESPFPSLRGLDLQQEDDHVLIKGNLETFFLKQLAQETVRSATRGIELINDICVVSDK